MCAMMGIYPMVPGQPLYTIITPRFKKITVKLNPEFYPLGELVIETDKDPGKYRRLKKGSHFISHDELVSKGLSLKLK
jgi:putative alpha-1,2-mannosidase